jgi:C4-dicarboxylate transporter, DctQ subunit
MKIIKKIDFILNKIEGAALISLLLVMLVMAFVQVVLRNFFTGGIVWGDIVLRHLVLWIGFLGAALATSGERHLNIDVLTRYFSVKIKGAVAAISDIFAAAVCYLLMKSAITFVEFEIENGTKIYSDIPSWFAEIIIPVGYGLLMIHFLIRAAIDAEKAVRKGGDA